MVPVPPEIVRSLDMRYPKPRIDREWLQGCYDWAMQQEGVVPIPPYTKALEAIQDQLLKSSLVDSMDPNSGLPQDIGDFKKTVTLPGVPTLVEIISLTEVGYSAFQLDQVRKAREERIRAGLDEYGEGDEEADLEVEGEGPLPKYPRSMLSFTLTDGKTTFKAFEYKPLPELSLVRTPLGFKLQLKNVKIVCGVAHLEPDSVVLLGNKSDMNDLKEHRFKQNLRERMGLPTEPDPSGDEAGDDENTGAPPPPPPAAANVRSPLREISPPSFPSLTSQQQRNDEEDAGPRRRRVPSTSSTLQPVVSRSRVSSATSAHFPPQDNPVPSSNMTMALSPTLRQTAPTLPSPVDDFDFDMFDEVDPQPPLRSHHQPPPAAASTSGGNAERVNHTTSQTPDPTLIMTSNPSAFPNVFSAAPTLKGRLQLAPAFTEQLSKNGATPDTLDSDDLFDGMDDDFDFGSDDLKLIDTAEQQALAGRAAPIASTARMTALPTPSSSSNRGPPPPRQPQRPSSPEIIDIVSDSDENDNGMQLEDKENLPVETRRVRRRVAGLGAGGPTSTPSRRGGETPSQRPGSQRTGSQANRPLVLASKPEDIFEISDSD